MSTTTMTDPAPKPTQLAVILAAGAGSRFVGDGHKLNAVLGDTTVAATAVSTALAADIGPVLVIVGDTVLEHIPDAAVVVRNPDWHQGQSTSLRAAAAHARRLGASAIVVGLADQPGITIDAWRTVASSTAPIAYATYDGQRGHPVRLDATVWDQLPTSGDAGARSLIQVFDGTIEALPCLGSTTDIDTREDLRRWQKNSKTNSP